MRRRPWGACVGAGVTVMCLAFAGCGSSHNKSSSSQTTTATTAAPTTAAPTTAAPTTPTTAAPATGFDTKYGSFTPTSHSGSSAAVVPVPAGAKAGLVEATYSGSGHFAVESLDAQNQMDDLLVNHVGAYTGTTAFGFGLSSKPPVNIQVTATGPWTLKISPISTAPNLVSPASGKGDAVYLWNGKATSWAITNQGTGHFAVETEGSGLFSHSLLVNQVGPFNGTVAAKAGPAVTIITSNGTWTITFS